MENTGDYPDYFKEVGRTVDGDSKPNGRNNLTFSADPAKSLTSLH